MTLSVYYHRRSFIADGRKHLIFRLFRRREEFSKYSASRSPALPDPSYSQPEGSYCRNRPYHRRSREPRMSGGWRSAWDLVPPKFLRRATCTRRSHSVPLVLSGNSRRSRTTRRPTAWTTMSDHRLRPLRFDPIRRRRIATRNVAAAPLPGTAFPGRVSGPRNAFRRPR